MYRIVGKRNTGKTSNLLLLTKENNGILVCKNPERMKEKAFGYGITGLTCMSYQDYIDSMKNDINKPIFIDEIEQFMRYLTEDHILGYSYTLE